MPESRKRQGNHHYKTPSDIPSGQRTKGRITWAILFGVFGLLIGIFAVGVHYVPMAIGLAAGALIGYVIGKRMEKDA